MTLIEQSEAVLCDAQFYLDRLSAEVYQRPIELLSGATIGQHSRHLIEFYQCLITQAPSGTVNYDLRQRNHLIEQNPTFASQVVDEIKHQISSLDPTTTLRFEGMNDAEKVATNVGRELIYNIEHTIHHLAIIKVGLKLEASELTLPESFGVAPSTLAYRKAILCAE
ncbi:MAG: DinB family protein [Lewinella sp.]